MAIPTIVLTDPAKLDDLLNTIGDAANTDIAALDSRIDSLEGGSGRGSSAMFVVANLSALDAVSTATIGDRAYMTAPGTGIDALIWTATAGSGATIDWAAQSGIVASSKANMDSFISAVAAIADTRFQIGSYWTDSATGTEYRFTSAVGAYAQTGGAVKITPTQTSTGGTVTVSNGEIVGSGAITQIKVTIPSASSYRQIRGRIQYIGGTAGSHTVKLASAGTAEATASSYRGQGRIDAGASVTAAALTAGTSWSQGYTGNRLERVRNFTIDNLGDSRPTTWVEYGSDMDAAANELTFQGTFRHTVSTPLDGFIYDFSSMGTFVELSIVLEGVI